MSQKYPSWIDPNGKRGVQQPDPEVTTRAKRRTFSAAYKLRILSESDRCSARGEIGALLRQEGLYSSHLTAWRRQRKTGDLQALAPKQRGRKAKQNQKDVKIAALQRENERLRRQLEQAELIIGAQKKLAAALEQTLTAGRDERS